MPHRDAVEQPRRARGGCGRSTVRGAKVERAIDVPRGVRSGDAADLRARVRVVDGERRRRRRTARRREQATTMSRASAIGSSVSELASSPSSSRAPITQPVRSSALVDAVGHGGDHRRRQGRLGEEQRDLLLVAPAVRAKRRREAARRRARAAALPSTVCAAGEHEEVADAVGRQAERAAASSLVEHLLDPVERLRGRPPPRSRSGRRLTCTQQADPSAAWCSDVRIGDGQHHMCSRSRRAAASASREEAHVRGAVCGSVLCVHAVIGHQGEAPARVQVLPRPADRSRIR